MEETLNNKDKKELLDKENEKDENNKEKGEI